MGLPSLSNLIEPSGVNCTVPMVNSCITCSNSWIHDAWTGVEVTVGACKSQLHHSNKCKDKSLPMSPIPKIHLSCVVLVWIVLVMIECRVPQKGKILAHQWAEGHFLQEVQVIAKGLPRLHKINCEFNIMHTHVMYILHTAYIHR